MFCFKCGTENSDESKFCCNCAAPLTTDAKEERSDKVDKEKLHSAHLLNIISAVVLALSIALIAYGVSTSTGGIDSVTETNGQITSSHSATVEYDTSGAPFAYAACAIDAIVVLIGFAVYSSKDISQKRKLAALYMTGACIMTCVLFFGGIKTISFTCGLGFIMTVAGILQITAGTKFLSATKHD